MSATAVAARPYRVLVFTMTAGYRHASIPDGVAAIRRLGAEHGFAVDEAADARPFTDAGLRPYAAVVWLSTTGNLLTAPEQLVFERYIRGGGGYVGVHAAADAEYGWAWYGGLVGAVFRSHPPIQRATVLIKDRRHPATASLPAAWTRLDEWYDFRANPGSHVHLLATDTQTTYPDGRRGGGHPVVWCQNYDGGRSFYVAFGHTSASWREPAFLTVVLGGIETAAGARPADCAPPSPSAPSPSARAANGQGTSAAHLVLGGLAALAAASAVTGTALLRRRRRRTERLRRRGKL
ncbi:MAG: ThuA domain-containing protein [Frankia sp.]